MKPETVKQAVFLGFLLLASIAASWNAASGGLMATADHPTRFTISWLFGEFLLPHLELDGWNPFFFGGYPASTFYPPLGFVLPALLKAAAAGLLTWELAYNLAVATSFLLLVLAAYFFVEKLGFGRTAAFFSALFFLVDFGMPGFSWESSAGFTQVFVWGMWNNTLSSALAFFALGSFVAFEGKKRIACTSLLIAASFLSNPWPAVWGVLAILLYEIVCMLANSENFTGRLRRLLDERLRLFENFAVAAGQTREKHVAVPLKELVLIAIAVIALTSFWTVPFLQNKEYHNLYEGYDTFKNGYGARPIQDLVDGFVAGRFMNILILALSAVGIPIALRKYPKSTAFLLATGALTLAWMSDFTLTQALPILNLVQNFRLAVYLHVILLAFAGIAVSYALAKVFGSKKLLATLVLALAITLSSWSFIPQVSHYGDCQDLSALGERLKAHETNTRIEFIGSSCNWHDFDAFPKYSLRPTLGTATNFNFYSEPLPLSTQDLQAWNVEHIVVSKNTPELQVLLANPDIQMEKEFSSIVLFRNVALKPSYFDAQHCTILNETFGYAKGEAEVDCTEESTIYFKTNYYPNWNAKINASPAAVGRGERNQLYAVVPAGRSFVRFNYSRPIYEQALLAISALTATALLAYLKLGKRTARKQTGKSQPDDRQNKGGDCSAQG